MRWFIRLLLRRAPAWQNTSWKERTIWRLPDMRRRYAGRFESFLNERIARVGHQEK